MTTLSHHDQVALVDRLEHQPAEARQVEHVLDDDGAGQQEGELQADDGQHRDQRVAQRVPPQRLPPAQALGAGGADIVLAQRLEQRRAHDAGEDRGLRQAPARPPAGSALAAPATAPADQPGKPPAGNQRSVMAKSSTSSIANQKFGTAMPSCVAPITPASASAVAPRRRPSAPTGMAISVESASASSASGSETTSRSRDQLGDRRGIGVAACRDRPSACRRPRRRSARPAGRSRPSFCAQRRQRVGPRLRAEHHLRRGRRAAPP